jgi:hypothetical protein
MMEAARTSETLVKLYQTTRCYNPEDSHLNTHRRENLKSYLKYTNLYILYAAILTRRVQEPDIYVVEGGAFGTNK